MSKQQIGFGGKNQQNFRILIDQDLKRGSKCFYEDDTFRKGHFINPNSKAQLSMLEVWGVVKSQTA